VSVYKRSLWILVILALVLAACQQLESGGEGYTAQGFHLPFPLPMADESQVEAALDCNANIIDLEEELFPESMSEETLAGLEIPEDDCERAAMAIALARRQGEDQYMPDVNTDPWQAMVESNTAFAFVDPVYYFYLGASGLVSPPSWAGDSLDQVALRYVWYGLGDEIEYELQFTPSGDGYDVEGQINGENFTSSVDEGLITGITDSLSGFIPVQQAAKLIVCMDNYPSWQIELTYSEGRVVNLNSSESNIFYLGGPWFANIDDQVYLQVSSAMVDAVVGIVQALELPVGSTAGMYCSDLPMPILSRIFPGEEAGE
jgi:hypothetical protein